MPARSSAYWSAYVNIELTQRVRPFTRAFLVDVGFI